jgi:Ca-activated chloride channel homolog
MRVLFLALSVMLLMTLTACGGSGGGSGGSGGAPSPAAGFETYTENGGVRRVDGSVDVYIVYSPESQQYMPELIRRFNQAQADGLNPVTGQPRAQGETPIYVWGTPPDSGSSGTVAQGILNALIAPNNANVYRPTIYQPSVSHWLGWVNFNSGRPIFDIASARGTALTPVVLAIWEERLQQLEAATGKPREQIGWSDILTVLNDGWTEGRRAVYYGHTDPRISSTGLSATIIEFYACARVNGFDGRKLTQVEVDDPLVQTCMQNIQQLVRHYSHRTEDFLEYFGQGPEYLDMLAMEEVDIICINQGGSQGDDQCLRPQNGRLVALYPAEGTFWHEHPFGVVNANWVTEAQSDAAVVFTDFVLLEDSQKTIMSYGFRPANPAVPVEFPFVESNGVLADMPAPVLDIPDFSVINQIQQSWTKVKKQADVMLLIDTSGSMTEENKMGNAIDAAIAFIEALESTNRIGLTTFSNDVRLRVPLDGYETVYNQVYGQTRGLRAEGGTELYAALYETIQALNNEPDADRVRAIVLLSDGADTGDRGVTLNQVVAALRESSTSLNPVIVIPIAYGSNADTTTLNAIAQASRTRVIPGDTDNIKRLLELISGYF